MATFAGSSLVPADHAPVGVEALRRPLAADRILDVLAAQSWTYRHEDDLQAAVSEVLTLAGIGHVREARLGPGERIDLLTDDGVGIEVKVAGSWTAAARQLLRYARHDRIRALVLVSSQAGHRRIPGVLGGVPVAVHSLIGQGL